MSSSWVTGCEGLRVVKCNQTVQRTQAIFDLRQMLLFFDMSRVWGPDFLRAFIY